MTYQPILKPSLPSLSSSTEKDWILGNIAVSKTVQRDIRYRIRKKLEILFSKELPLLMDKGFLVDKANVLCQPSKFVINTHSRSIATNGDGVVPNGDGTSVGGGRWSSLVKIPPLTRQNVNDNVEARAYKKTKTNNLNTKCAGSGVKQI